MWEALRACTTEARFILACVWFPPLGVSARARALLGWRLCPLSISISLYLSLSLSISFTLSDSLTHSFPLPFLPSSLPLQISLTLAGLVSFDRENLAAWREAELIDTVSPAPQFYFLFPLPITHLSPLTDSFFLFFLFASLLFSSLLFSSLLFSPSILHVLSTSFPSISSFGSSPPRAALAPT